MELPHSSLNRWKETLVTVACHHFGGSQHLASVHLGTHGHQQAPICAHPVLPPLLQSKVSDSSTPLDEHRKLIPGPSLCSAAYNRTYTRVTRCIACRRLLSPAPVRRFALGPVMHPPVAASFSALLLGILVALTFAIRVDMCLGKPLGLMIDLLSLRNFLLASFNFSAPRWGGK
jgi:hypothetical protein